MPTPSLLLIVLASGPAALYVNDKPVMQDDTGKDAHFVELVAESLATAMDCGLERAELPTPASSTWSWDELHEKYNAKRRAVAHGGRGRPHG